ncbi:hypothetical protein [Rhizobium leguminosarum]|uniref:hypothetical protein n=1 Tax=Rhizobium leguminosarum TaxID=384 RepID=UPI0004228ACF|nr:hypothetical protein [Rhizobium leguminosarum]
MTDAPVPFRKRRTYLDECRERGVFQEREELMAENADLASQLANKRREASAEVHDIADKNSEAAAFADALKVCRDEMHSRTKEIIEAFQRAEVGIEYLPLLTHVIINTSTPAGQAEDLFRAARSSYPNLRRLK